MAKEVVGVYENQSDLIQAIERFKEDGYSVQDFSIIGDTPDLPAGFENRTGVSTESVDHVVTDENQDNRSGGFWHNLMNVFDGDENLGGNSASLNDRLVQIGLTEEAAREYEEDVREGRIILLTEGLVPEQTSFVGNEANLQSSTAYTEESNDVVNSPVNEYGDERTEERSMQLREEQLNISKDRVQAGEVEIHKEVVEEQQNINIPVTREEVYVERRSVNEEDFDGTIANEDETIRVPIMEERVEVHKQPVVSEELVIGKREVEDTERVVESVKREEARVETDGDEKVIDRNMSSDYKDRE
ncbi:YsnF/AvaK domain-containing protein [Mesobacillus foraminis]|uniref:Uncharacterized protein (TIGR02271 family) n=1 Tax=Mesobacillus foraminis TaxID=279826 RepID=A0A4R2BNJ4_9BACI|nr:YsnF/AvaK domain-containing protein [Mesobacillus foraminis]TCN27759.1 uncharacterized protein (TIGR02271 family) [Mesobacillus foraminis]